MHLRASGGRLLVLARFVLALRALGDAGASSCSHRDFLAVVVSTWSRRGRLGACGVRGLPNSAVMEAFYFVVEVGMMA